MKAIIADGTHECDYLVSLFKKEKFDITVINSDLEWVKYIGNKNNVEVFYGDPTKAFILSEADIKNADIFIALSENDINNYVACSIAKKMFNINKVICTVLNPKYVSIFEELGIDVTISSTHLLANKIFERSALDHIYESLSFENELISVTEIEITDESRIVNEYLKDITFPIKATISCIFRDQEIIIPYGGTKILKGDKIFVLTLSKDFKKITNYINRV